jgi:ribonuclease R
MFDRVIPMLPFELSNGICSLNAGEDRFTLSCIMEIDKKGHVKSADICKSVIKVTERMSYNDVYKIITNSDEAVVKRYEKYVSCFKDMEELAHILKDKRQNQGYLNLEIPESKIILDKNGKAIDVKKYEINFANEIIEQFMLTANETIAEKFFWLEAPFIYRVHEAPDLDKIEETNQVLFFGGYRIKASKDNINPKAFADVLNQTNGTSEEKIMSTLILRTLKLARYEAENKGHFGIASKYYCHFTSPIRRYPDLFIHRVISEYLENDYLLSEERIQELNEKAVKYAKISSDAEMLATKVEREAESIKKAEFMADKIGQEFDGIISSLTNFGMFVQLENTVEGLVRFEDMGFDDYFTLDDKRKILVGEQSGKVFKIGKKTRVRVIEANKILRKVSFELVNGKAQPQEL